MPTPAEYHKLEKIFLENCGLELHELIPGESTAYDGCNFKLNNKSIEFRTSKITPKKIGQFVAIWRRNEKGLTQPYNETDSLDFMIISSSCGDKSGWFIFPKSVLISQAIITTNNTIGKRGIRVYPPWDKTISSQAQKTQSWQIGYFVTIDGEASVDRVLLAQLLPEV